MRNIPKPSFESWLAARLKFARVHGDAKASLFYDLVSHQLLKRGQAYVEWKLYEAVEDLRLVDGVLVVDLKLEPAIFELLRRDPLQGVQFTKGR